MKIYLPEDLVNSSCKVINNGYIRVYKNNNYTSWVDVYVNQDYMRREGYSNYSQNPVCDTTNEYTSSIGYRVDFLNILLVFTIIVVIWWFLVSKVLKTLIKGLRWS